MTLASLFLVLAWVVALVVAYEFFWPGGWWAKRHPASPAPNLPANWGDDSDDERWNQEAVDVSHTYLTGIRSVSEKWAGTIATLLGVFGTVAFIKGPEAWDKLQPGAAYVVAIGVLLAGLAAGAAVLSAALAAQGTPELEGDWNGWVLKQAQRRRAREATKNLRLSRLLAAASALTLVTAMGIAWFDSIGGKDSDKADAPTVLVVRDGLPPICGTLSLTDDGALAIVPSPSASPVILKSASSFTPVDACPKSE